MADHETAGEIESEADALAEGQDAPEIWLKHIERAKEDEKDWFKTAKAAVAVYEADESSESGSTSPAFNILHSNIETTVPALYNSTPIPDIRRRFGDADPVGKAAVDVIERGLMYTIDEYNFDGVIAEAARDGDLAGRGTARLRYEPEIVGEQVGSQKITTEHVIWDKWGRGPARSWAEVPWIFFEHDYTKADLERLGVSKKRIKELTFNDVQDRNSDTKAEKSPTGILKTVRGYEVWDKRSRAVMFIAEQDKKKFLAVKPDPLGLKDFFPVPAPLQPLRRRRDITPICPYEVYRLLVAELDRITKRINGLISQCRVRGLYDKRLGADLERLRFCDDGQYEPAEDATIFAQGSGGLEKAVMHWPLQEIITTLKELYVQREQIKQIIYEVTGLSDVLRGATNPNETLGAQQLKAQSGSRRMSTRQKEVARFCRDLFRMKAEVMCKHFTAENLSQMTAIQVTPEVEQLLRNDLMRSYRVDIETDSTIRADVSRSQEQMSLFLQGTAQYITSMSGVLEVAPGATQALVEIYASFARNFKLGKSAEDALDKLTQMAQQPPEPKPDPEQQKMQMEGQRMQAQMQADQQKMQIDMQLKQMDMQLKQFELQVKQQLAAIDMEKAQLDIQAKRESMNLDQQAKIFDMQTRKEMSSIDIQSRRQKTQADADARQQKMDQEHEAREAKKEAMGASDD